MGIDLYFEPQTQPDIGIRRYRYSVRPKDDRPIRREERHCDHLKSLSRNPEPSNAFLLTVALSCLNEHSLDNSNLSKLMRQVTMTTINNAVKSIIATPNFDRDHRDSLLDLAAHFFDLPPISHELFSLFGGKDDLIKRDKKSWAHLKMGLRVRGSLHPCK